MQRYVVVCFSHVSVCFGQRLFASLPVSNDQHRLVQVRLDVAELVDHNDDRTKEQQEEYRIMATYVSSMCFSGGGERCLTWPSANGRGFGGLVETAYRLIGQLACNVSGPMESLCMENLIRMVSTLPRPWYETAICCSKTHVVFGTHEQYVSCFCQSTFTPSGVFRRDILVHEARSHRGQIPKAVTSNVFVIVMSVSSIRSVGDKAGTSRRASLAGA